MWLPPQHPREEGGVSVPLALSFTGRGDIQPQLDSALQDVNDKYLLLEETEKQAVRKALIEERGRFCTFISMLRPVIVSGQLQEAQSASWEETPSFLFNRHAESLGTCWASGITIRETRTSVHVAAGRTAYSSSVPSPSCCAYFSPRVKKAWQSGSQSVPQSSSVTWELVRNQFSGPSRGWGPSHLCFKQAPRELGDPLAKLNSKE